MMTNLKTQTFDGFERNYIRAGAFRGLADMLGGRSAQFDSLVEAAGLSPACLTEPDSYIGAQPFGATLQLVSSRMNRPSVGLDWAAWSKPYFPQLGPLMLASAHARTLRDFIELAGRYLPGHTNAYRPRLIYQSVRTELAYRFEINSRTLDRRQVIEHLLAVTSLIFEVLTGVTENKHILVRFRHARPADITPHQAIFRSPVEFNADHNEIIFASKQLELPILCSQRNIKNCALHLINDRMADLPDVDGSVSSRVAIAIRAMLGVGVISLDTLAGCLDVGPKTLQRRLAEEGNSYGELLDRIRKAEALRLMATTHLPVHLVGSKLDYSSAPAFNLAFKRWTGTSPRAYRQAVGTEAGPSPSEDVLSAFRSRFHADIPRFTPT
ncbi:AraC family transcriptional regulator ligand-binding domain-containing protein [Rhizobium sp. SG2393]|uniref:AraC family transcriptional regulator n=1 Tax=Rhizobium sp. SG2393 TaxID=3276279 RepID=UPI00366C4EA2